MKALVTGGGGFLGGAIVTALLERGDEVVSVARSDYPALTERGVTVRQADLSAVLADEQIKQIFAGAEVVFHVAAKAGIWGSAAEFQRCNVAATRNVIDACRRAGVRKLVFTSTPSVVHTGKDISAGNEQLPYTTDATPYPRTKAVAEQDVLAANSSRLATVALRPHLIWGPGDTQLVPRIISRARSGRLRFPGDGQALIDSTYITDAALSHLAAADALSYDSVCAGRPYFISQGEPRTVLSLVNGILAAAGLPPETRTVPVPVAVAAGALAETAWRLLQRDEEPPMTRFLAHQLSTAHWFDISAAKRDLRWSPIRTIDGGLSLLADSLQDRQI